MMRLQKLRMVQIHTFFRGFSLRSEHSHIKHALLFSRVLYGTLWNLFVQAIKTY